MTQFGRIRTLAVFVLTLWVCFSFARLAKAESTKDAILQFRILLDKSELAAGSSSITIDVELLNVSPKNVKFSPDGIGAQISIRNLPCSFKDDVRTSSLIADPIGGLGPGKSVTLAAGETYRRRVVVHLTKDFTAPGIYAISMAFSGGVGGRGLPGAFLDDLDSNEVLFAIMDDLGPAQH
jgi:hypothetical protein